MVKVYGADWCGPTQQVLKYLDTQGVDYQYINVEEDTKASQWVKDQNDGKELKPTLAIGSRVLSEPNQSELDSVLQSEGLI